MIQIGVGHWVRDPCRWGHSVTMVRQNKGSETTRALFLACNVCSTVIGADDAEYNVHFFKGATLGFGD